MYIREVWVLVDDGDVFVPMIVRLAAVPFEGVPVLVVSVVRVHVTMGERLMKMLVFVALGQVQVYAPGHQAGRNPERRIGGLIE